VYTLCTHCTLGHTQAKRARVQSCARTHAERGAAETTLCLKDTHHCAFRTHAWAPCLLPPPQQLLCARPSPPPALPSHLHPTLFPARAHPHQRLLVSRQPRPTRAFLQRGHPPTPRRLAARASHCSPCAIVCTLQQGIQKGIRCLVRTRSLVSTHASVSVCARRVAWCVFCKPVAARRVRRGVARESPADFNDEARLHRRHGMCCERVLFCHEAARGAHVSAAVIFRRQWPHFFDGITRAHTRTHERAHTHTHTHTHTHSTAHTLSSLCSYTQTWARATWLRRLAEKS